MIDLNEKNAGKLLLALCQEVSRMDGDGQYQGEWSLVTMDGVGLSFVHDKPPHEIVMFMVTRYASPLPEVHARAGSPFFNPAQTDPLIIEQAERQPDGRIRMVRRDYHTGEEVKDYTFDTKAAGRLLTHMIQGWPFPEEPLTTPTPSDPADVLKNLKREDDDKDS